MFKTELIDAVAAKAGMTKTATERILGTLVEVIAETLANGGEVNITNFGKFAVLDRKDRNGVNPRTRKPMLIRGTKFPVFRAGKNLKALIRR